MLLFWSKQPSHPYLVEAFPQPKNNGTFEVTSLQRDKLRGVPHEIFWYYFLYPSGVQKGPKFDFQSQFSKSKIIWICVIFFSFKNVILGEHFLFLTFFDNVHLKPSIITCSKPRRMRCTRLLICFILQHSVIKTKHLRSLVLGVIRGFGQAEILGFRNNLFSKMTPNLSMTCLKKTY